MTTALELLSGYSSSEDEDNYTPEQCKKLVEFVIAMLLLMPFDCSFQIIKKEIIICSDNYVL